MSQKPTCLGEVKRRIDCGVAGIREAAYLTEYIERLTFAPESNLCRICGLPRSMGHADYCAAREVV